MILLGIISSLPHNSKKREIKFVRNFCKILIIKCVHIIKSFAICIFPLCCCFSGKVKQIWCLAIGRLRLVSSSCSQTSSWKQTQAPWRVLFNLAEVSRRNGSGWFTTARKSETKLGSGLSKHQRVTQTVHTGRFDREKFCKFN